MAELNIHVGSIAKPIEQQANLQGYTIGEDAEMVESSMKYAHLLWFKGFLSDTEHEKVCKRIVKHCGKVAKPLAGVGE